MVKKGSTDGLFGPFFRHFWPLRGQNLAKNPEFKNKFDRVSLVFGEIRGLPKPSVLAKDAGSNGQKLAFLA